MLRGSFVDKRQTQDETQLKQTEERKTKKAKLIKTILK